MERYSRQIILPEIGQEGQEKLLKAKVLVVGAGGLGSPVLHYLAAAGIGRIGIADDDVVSESNLQRQILYVDKDIGQPKLTLAQERLLSINPYIKIDTYPLKLDYNNASVIAKKYHIIVDCTDNYYSRYVIDSVSQQLGIPMVYGSVSKFLGQVAIFNHLQSKSYKDLFPESPAVTEEDKSNLGVLGPLVGIIGSIQSNEVIKLLLGLKDNLVQKLFVIDSKTMKTNILPF